MDMIVVNLNSIDKVKKFVNTIAKYDCSSECWNVGGIKVFSASSIMSIFSLDFNEPVGVKINTNDKETAKQFYKEMRELNEG